MENIHTALPNAFARIMGLEGPPQDMEASEVWAGWYLVKAREIYPFSDIPDTMDHLLATLAAVRMEDPLAVMDMKERAQRDIKHLQEALRTQDRATWIESPVGAETKEVNMNLTRPTNVLYYGLNDYTTLILTAIDTNITTTPRDLYGMGEKFCHYCYATTGPGRIHI
ncbi:hypothetical protein J3E68DRAFT_448618 [Trichoderma sp. SZMC 28012]